MVIVTHTPPFFLKTLSFGKLRNPGHVWGDQTSRVAALVLVVMLKEITEC